MKIYATGKHAKSLNYHLSQSLADSNGLAPEKGAGNRKGKKVGVFLREAGTEEEKKDDDKEDR